jgi:tRNA(fMet)-specific endonuclease VapC
LSRSYLLDTNILMALIRGNALGRQIDEAYGLRASLQRHVVSIVSQAEIWVIADRREWGEAKRDALRTMFDHVVVVPIDGQGLLDAYVKIAAADGNHSKGPRNMGKNDLWIAATALHTGLPLLTTDKDFLFLNKNLLNILWVDPDSANANG